MELRSLLLLKWMLATYKNLINFRGFVFLHVDGVGPSIYTCLHAVAAGSPIAGGSDIPLLSFEMNTHVPVEALCIVSCSSMLFLFVLFLLLIF